MLGTEKGHLFLFLTILSALGALALIQRVKHEGWSNRELSESLLDENRFLQGKFVYSEEQRQELLRELENCQSDLRMLTTTAD